MAVPPAEGDRPGVTSASRVRRILPGILVVALVVLLGAGAWLVTTRVAEVPAVGLRLGSPTEAQQERTEALRTGRTFVERMSEFGPDDLEGQKMPGYRERVSELMSPKFSEAFLDTGVQLAEATVAQAKMGRSVEVDSAGVEEIHADSAEILVAGAITNSYPNPDGDGRVEDQPLPFRYRVSLVKIEGEWLVDNYVPVVPGQDGRAGQDGEGGQDGGLPLEQPGGQDGSGQGGQEQQPDDEEESDE